MTRAAIRASVRATVDAGADPRDPLLVGRDNPYGADPAYALIDFPDGCSGHRLRRFLGLPSERYARLPRVNLCDGPFTLREARVRVAELRAAHPDRDFLLFGRDVQRAFGVAVVTAFDKARDPLRICARPAWGRAAPVLVPCPHPSGLCREWTRSGMVAAFRACVAELAHHLPLASADDAWRS